MYTRHFFDSICERLETLAENLESCDSQLGKCSQLQRAALQKQQLDANSVDYDQLLEESRGRSTASDATKVLKLINKKIEGIRLTRTETYAAIGRLLEEAYSAPVNGA